MKTAIAQDEKFCNVGIDTDMDVWCGLDCFFLT